MLRHDQSSTTNSQQSGAREERRDNTINSENRKEKTNSHKTPFKDPIPAARQEEAHEEEVVPPTPTAQEEAPAEEEILKVHRTEPTAQEEPSTPAEEKPNKETEEERYQIERKRKGKAPIQKKQGNKKPPTINTRIVIQEPTRGNQLRMEETSDGDYTSSEESDSEDNVSVENEEFQERQLPENHHELVHPPVERLEYRPWQVELDDDLMEDMKRYNTKKLQDAFDGKDDNNKLIKSGKVLHFPSLDELAAREPFLSYMCALGFDWLLENEDPAIPVRLAKEFFTTFRFQVTTDLADVLTNSYFHWFNWPFDVLYVELIA